MFNFEEDNASHNHLQFRAGGNHSPLIREVKEVVSILKARTMNGSRVVRTSLEGGYTWLPCLSGHFVASESAYFHLSIGRRVCMHHEAVEEPTINAHMGKLVHTPSSHPTARLLDGCLRTIRVILA